MAVVGVPSPKISAFVTALQARPVPAVVARCLDEFVVRAGADLARSAFSKAA